MAAATAAALDAADGVMDGRHFGRPIVQAGAPAFGGFTQFAQPAFASYGTTFAQPAFGGFAAPTYFGGASQTAAALDAADGVIDGKHFGRPIVQAGAPSVYGSPFVSGASFGYGAPFGTTYGATTYGAPFAGSFVGGASSTAAALDAADGVIDGKHFGRPIVQAGAPAFAGGLVPYTGVASQVVAGPSFVGAAPVSYGAVPAQYYGGYGVPSYGATYAPATYGAPVYGAAPVANYGYGYGRSAQRAAALDAADGVIDGKHFGRPIVQKPRRF
jgi:hypothetical protein